MDSIQRNYCKIPPRFDGPTSWFKLRLVVQVKNKLQYQKELMVKPEMCWNNVWEPAERQQDLKQKEDPVHDKKPQLKK